MPQVQIRPTLVDDLPVLMQIDHSCQSEYVWQMDIQLEGNQVSTTFREIRLPRPVTVRYPRPVAALSESWNQRVGFLSALIADTPIGYVRINDLILPYTAWVTDLVVAPRYRRQGVGLALLLAAQQWARNRQNSRIMLEMTNKNIPAIRLAQKLGFEFCGYNDTYYESQEVALFFVRSIS
ncbi:MAG: GNAT family N-acetyltransferase [Anaerolineales bacterium]|nr:GNAT family N-acetyltransferase [Anaerolineales bacterium]MDW8227535.1 GNAT family N-acetyltransferase [Anaerolineales bacterium]